MTTCPVPCPPCRWPYLSFHQPRTEADPSLRVAAGLVWAAGDKPLALGELSLEQPGALLLEGMGRALLAVEPIERGLDAATPEAMQLTPAEAFVLVHKFITSGSVEERIDRMIKEKSKLAEEIVGSGEDWLGGLEMGQLKELVALTDE